MRMLFSAAHLWPAERLSKIKALWPEFSTNRAVWLPIYPAPPVTRIFTLCSLPEKWWNVVVKQVMTGNCLYRKNNQCRNHLQSWSAFGSFQPSTLSFTIVLRSYEQTLRLSILIPLYNE